MEHISIDDVEPQAMGGGDLDRRGLAEALGAENVAVNRYALDPGENFSGGMHAHLDQEEIFYVVSGEATFETAPEPDAETETVTVGPDEAVRFAPGEYQQGRNESDETVVALALGAPKDSTEGRVAQPCPDCESPAMALVPGPEGLVMECPECGAEMRPEM
jgi:mannose-6-phosphate isomerase-like protein (cupin superfamily)